MGWYFSWYIYILSSTNFIITSIIQKSRLLSLLHLSSGGSSCGGHSQVPGVLRSPHLCSLETGSAEEENPNLFSSSDWSRLLQRCASLLLASLTRCSRVIQRLHSMTSTCVGLVINMGCISSRKECAVISQTLFMWCSPVCLFNHQNNGRLPTRSVLHVSADRPQSGRWPGPGLQPHVLRQRQRHWLSAEYQTLRGLWAHF